MQIFCSTNFVDYFVNILLVSRRLLADLDHQKETKLLYGRFDPEFFRALAAGQVSASDRPPDDDETAFGLVIPRIWMSIAGLVAVICLLSLT